MAQARAVTAAVGRRAMVLMTIALFSTCSVGVISDRVHGSTYAFEHAADRAESM